MVDSTSHLINRYPVDDTIGFPNAYPRNSDLSGGHRYPPFEHRYPPFEDSFVNHFSVKLISSIKIIIIYLTTVAWAFLGGRRGGEEKKNSTVFIIRI